MSFISKGPIQYDLPCPFAMTPVDSAKEDLGKDTEELINLSLIMLKYTG
jgi:hypothetical protein